jgi:hypothetical protein
MKVIYSLIVVVALFIAGFLFTASSEAKIDSKAIAGMWLFDEGQDKTTDDFSGNNNNGELMNNAKWGNGKFGNALIFDGASSYVILSTGINCAFLMGYYYI